MAIAASVPGLFSEVAHQPSINAIFRTGRLLAPSMPVSNSTRPALPPQPSWRIRSMMVRIGRSRCAVCASFSIRSLPQRSQVIRMNHEGNALNGSSSASWPEGNGSVPRGAANSETGKLGLSQNPQALLQLLAQLRRDRVHPEGGVDSSESHLLCLSIAFILLYRFAKLLLHLWLEAGNYRQRQHGILRSLGLIVRATAAFDGSMLPKVRGAICAKRRFFSSRLQHFANAVAQGGRPIEQSLAQALTSVIFELVLSTTCHPGPSGSVVRLSVKLELSPYQPCRTRPTFFCQVVSECFLYFKLQFLLDTCCHIMVAAS